jgi:cytoskeletal protein CcmA (bactofilin family)
MKKLITILSISVVAIVVISFGVAHAQSFRTGNSTNVGVNEVIDSSLWAAGSNVDIAGQVNGDVFCAGQTVTVSGTVQGDVICAAQTLIISGTVQGSVRSVGQTVTISGNVLHNLTAAGQSFTLDESSKIGGDASIAANNIILNGKVGRDLIAGASTLTVNGGVGRNVDTRVTHLYLNHSAHIGGNLSYTSKNNVVISTGAVINGTTTKSLPKAQPSRHFGSFIGISLLFGLFFLLAGIVTSLVLVLLFPQAIHSTTNQAIKNPWKVLLVGFITTLIAPILIIAMMITVIGIPLALFVLGIWFLISVLGGIMSAYYLGRLLWSKQHNPIIIMLIGALILIIFSFIPIIGAIIGFIAVIMGIGMIVLEIKHRLPMPKYYVK